MIKNSTQYNIYIQYKDQNSVTIPFDGQYHGKYLGYPFKLTSDSFFWVDQDSADFFQNKLIMLKSYSYTDDSIQMSLFKFDNTGISGRFITEQHIVKSLKDILAQDGTFSFDIISSVKTTTFSGTAPYTTSISYSDSAIVFLNGVLLNNVTEAIDDGNGFLKIVSTQQKKYGNQLSVYLKETSYDYTYSFMLYMSQYNCDGVPDDVFVDPLYNVETYLDYIQNNINGSIYRLDCKPISFSIQNETVDIYKEYSVSNIYKIANKQRQFSLTFNEDVVTDNTADGYVKTINNGNDTFRIIRVDETDGTIDIFEECQLKSGMNFTEDMSVNTYQYTITYGAQSRYDKNNGYFMSV